MISQSFAEKKEYIFGVVPQFEKRRLHKTWKPIIEFMGQEVGLEIKYQPSESIENFSNALSEGQFDIAYANPYQALNAYSDSGYEFLVRSGDRKLQGILITRKENPIDSIEKISNEEIAFPANAFAASFLIQAELTTRHKIDLKPVYLKTHSTGYLYACKGIIPFAAGVKQTFDEQPKSIREKLKIVYETRETNPHPIVIKKKIPSALIEAMRQAFKTLEKKHPDWLKKIPMSSITNAEFEDYANLKELDLDQFIQSQE